LDIIHLSSIGGVNMSPLVMGMIGAMIAVIIGVSVAIPVINETITDANLTGTTGTIIGYLPLILAIVILVAIVALIR